MLKHASTVPAEARGTFLVQAAQHFLSLRYEVDRYALLPVDIRTFVEGEGFLNRRGVLFPAVMEELRELNSGKYDEAVLTGAIGTGKSTIALFTTAYQLYVLSCLKDPHRLFSLDPASEIVFAFQSLNKDAGRIDRLHAVQDNDRRALLTSRITSRSERASGLRWCSPKTSSCARSQAM